MDMGGRLQQLEQLVRDAKSMPLSSSVLVSREEALQMISAMQESLPEEIKQARWIVRDREELLAKARADGEKVVDRALEEQTRLARREEIAKRAQEEADRIIEDAEDRAASMTRESEDYVDAKLAQFENTLRRILEDSQATTRAVSKTLDQIEVGRERLRTTQSAAHELAPKEPEGEYFDEQGAET